jgi:diguanylate cyclase (GGDEF)-like protein/PAS domain S-box-containing protein
MANMPKSGLTDLASAKMDALQAHLAILDEEGTIVSVNRAWREFAAANAPAAGSANVCEGTNYLSVCEGACGASSEEALDMVIGMRAVLSGQQDEFLLEYPCHSPTEERWFTARVARFSTGSQTSLVIVTHEDITARKLSERALTTERALLRTIIEHVPIAVHTTSAEGGPVNADATDPPPRPVPACETRCRTSMEFYPEDVAATCMPGDWAMIETGGSVADCEDLASTATGDIRWLLTSKIAWRNSAGDIIGIVEIRHDITERRRAENLLRDSEARYRAVTQTAADAIIIADGTGSIVGWNRSAERIFGYTEDEIRVRQLSALMPEWHPTDVYACIGRTAPSGDHGGDNTTVEATGQRKDGSEFPLELSVSHWEVNDAQFLTVIIRDITERKAMEERMIHHAFHDPLTNLANRVLFQDRLSRALARCMRSGKSVAVLFLDVDNFKLINDSLGHAVGDNLLECVAQRIQRVMRVTDTAARFGGDEFTILVEDIEGEADARAVAERVLAQFLLPITLASREVFVNASLGIAISAHSLNEHIELLRNADAAMHSAKSHGRGRYEVYDVHMNVHALRRLEMESELRGAVERMELVLHYQPVISLASGAIMGFEALVRWNHPTRGIISPLGFVPLAEETGLILPIGHWVLTEACRQMQEWRARHSAASGMYVAVNLSARQFQQPSLVGEVARALEECGLPPSCLTLEITETVAMEETEFTLATLEALKAAGPRIAIDDFGTGYSSLSYLRRFPVDYLKIDRSFIDGLDRDEDRLIVSSTIGLAHSLGLTVIAEGAESSMQVGLLRDLACDTVQGYFYHRPLPASEIETLLASGTAHDLPAPHSASNEQLAPRKRQRLLRAAVDLHRIRDISSSTEGTEEPSASTPAACRERPGALR